MPKWRYVYVENDKALSGTSGTHTMDLPNKDFLAGLIVGFKETNPSVSAGICPTFNHIPKMEIMDGSRVIQSLSGTQAQALAWYRGKKYGYNNRNESETMAEREYFYLPLGLSWQDPKHMLNLDLLTSPQFKFTWDVASTTFDGITYDAGTDTTPDLTVIALLCDGTPAGFENTFVQSSQIHTYSMAAGGTQHVEIPRDRPLLGLMLRGAYVGKRVIDDFGKIKLNVNNGEWIPIEVEDYEIEQLQEDWFGHAVASFRAMPKTDGTRFDSGFGKIDGIGVHCRGKPVRPLEIEGLYGGWLRLKGWDVEAGAASETFMHVKILETGLFPHHTVYIPMEKLVTDGKVLDIREFRRVLLEITSLSTASASSTPTIVAEYLEENA